LALNGLKISVREFWEMPFFILVDLIKQINPSDKRSISRKEMIASMIDTKKRLGWL
jgi:hypothetical protein